MRSENWTICSFNWCNPRHSIFSRLDVANTETKPSSLRNERKLQFQSSLNMYPNMLTRRLKINPQSESASIFP